jgi:hypothetical protein
MTRLQSLSFVHVPEAAVIFADLLQWAKDHDRKLPSLQWVRSKYPDAPIPDHVNRSLEELSSEVIDNMLSVEIQDALETFQRMVKRNPARLQEGVHFLRDQFNLLDKATETASVKDMQEIVDRAKYNYELLEKGKGYTEYPWPWDYMNEATGGLYRGSFYAIRGLPNNYKSWILFYIAATLLQQAPDIRIGIQSQELSEEIILFRLAAILLKLDWSKVHRGNLAGDEKQLFFAMLDHLHNANKLIFIPRDVSYTRLQRIVDIEGLHGLFLDSFYDKLIECPKLNESFGMDDLHDSVDREKLTITIEGKEGGLI